MSKTVKSEKGSLQANTTMAEALWTPPALDLSVDRYAAWRAWKAKWIDYCIVTELEKKAPEYQSAMLRYTFTDETRNIYESLNLSETDAKDTAKIIDALEKFAKGIVNETLERHLFNSRGQEEGELFDDFLTDIKILSKNCGFCGSCHDSLVRDRIVAGVNDDQLRKRLLSDSKLDLQKAENICRSYEKATQGMEALNESKTEINLVQSRKSYKQNRPANIQHNQKSRAEQKASSQQKPCKFCCRQHQWGREFCPAWNKKCNTCSRLNHFSNSIVCRGKEEVPSEEMGSLFLGSLNGPENVNETFEIEMQVSKGTLSFKVDTGADASAISDKHLDLMGIKETEIKQTRKNLIGPGGEKLNCLGFVNTTLSWNGKKTQQIIYVCKNLQKALLGKPAIREMNIITFNRPQSISCNTVDTKEHVKEENDFMKEFSDVFTGLGHLKGEPVKIKLKEGVTPFHLSAPRHIAIPMLDKVKEEIQKMERLGVIRKVNHPTEWCHPIVVVGKPNGKIRLCIDLTKLNLGIKREFYQIESVEETISKIGPGCEVFTKLDANSGYWQVPLDEDSQLLTTFITPFGRYCCTRGPFGLSSMQEIFNKKMDNIVEDLEGVAKSTDDFLVYGKNKAEHDSRLRKLLSRFRENNVTLNKEKCKFSVAKVDFIGHEVDKDGLKPLSSRVSAILDYPIPKSITELRRFLGMANQLSKYSTELATAAEPLRDLLSAKNDWKWTEVHTSAINKVKEVLSSSLVLAHFDIKKPTMLRSDGSKLNGISVVLKQQQENGDWKPVACASRFLSDAEKNYHPIEVEMLAITWGCEKMNLYLHGLLNFLIVTDHKPLIPILQSKLLGDMSPRIQSMRMRLMKYSFEVEHCPGKDLVDVDAFSRAPTQLPKEEELFAERDVECHVMAALEQMPASDSRLEEIRSKTCEDETLVELTKIISRGWPAEKKDCSESIKPYWDSRAGLTTVNGLVLRGSQIVIPKSMRKDMLERIHEGHLGIVKCKRRARNSCYWPNMSTHIEDMVKRCETCRREQPSKEVEELQPHEIPVNPWQRIGTDLFQYAGRNYLIVTDYYSYWPEVYELNPANAPSVVKATKEAFSRHGIPETVISDNGSQYSSKQYKQFAREWQFLHKTSSPRYPQSNGLAESSVRVVKQLLKKCKGSKQDIRKGLLILRNTPLACGKSPAELLMGRRLRDNMPSVNEERLSDRDLVTERLKQKEHHDRKKASQRKIPNDFQVNQRVAIQHHQDKTWSIKGRILEQVADRSFIIKTDHGSIIRRNTKFIRRVHPIISSTMPENNSEKNHHIPVDERQLQCSQTGMTGNAKRSRYGRVLKPKKPTDYDEL